MGSQSDVGSTEQMDQRQLALSAAERARKVSSHTSQQPASATLEPQIETSKGVEL
jgi:hypothetical protein